MMCSCPDECARAGLANVVRAGIVQATVSKGARVHSMRAIARLAQGRKRADALKESPLLAVDNGCRALQSAERRFGCEATSNS